MNLKVAEVGDRVWFYDIILEFLKGLLNVAQFFRMVLN
jgi:hypothetical protein